MMKLKDVELTDWTTGRPPVCVVLEALYHGIEIPMGGHRLRMANTEDGGQRIIAVLGEDDFVGFDLTLENLSTFSNKLSIEELAAIVGNLVLSKNARYGRLR